MLVIIGFLNLNLANLNFHNFIKISFYLFANSIIIQFIES